MTFTHSAIGKNTDENRKWLEGLGYEIENAHEEGELLHSFPRMHGNDILYWCAVPYRNKFLRYISREYTDCTHSDELFRAVTAMREDSDYMQWFADGKDWYKHLSEEASGFLIRMKRHGFHKATLSELINHFK